MNYRVVFYIIGQIMELEGAFMLLPALVALIYGETQGLSYLAVAAAVAGTGFVMSRKKPANMNFYLKEGFVLPALPQPVRPYFRRSMRWQSAISSGAALRTG